MSRSIPRLALAVLVALAGCDDETGPDNERFVATLSGANENPPVSTTATGTAEFEVEEDGSVVYELAVNNMAQITAAHIHGPAPSTANAGVLVSLFPTSAGQAVPTGTVNGTLAQGRFSAADNPDVPMDSVLRLMRSGNAYVNVHTTTHRPGEIRGQIGPRR